MSSIVTIIATTIPVLKTQPHMDSGKNDWFKRKLYFTI